MNSPNRLAKIEDLFHAALEREPAERAAFLDEACADDSSLRDAVNDLLAAHDKSWSLVYQRHAAIETDNTSDPTRRMPKPPVPQGVLVPAPHSSDDGQREGRFVTGQMLAGRYRIVGLLGKGGMGEVYKAEDIKLKQTVALKFLPESIALDGGMLARFHNEVRIARQVAHPNVCRVYDIGEVEGLSFLSMEFIDGEDLSSLLRRIGCLHGDKASEIAWQICAGLAAVHDNGVLHRDLKPANVMIDGRGKAHITDFGLAVMSGEFHGEGRFFAGTPAYMAPEQLTGKEFTQHSDIYALGLVLYELFTGKRAFEAKSLQELIRLHEKSSPPRPSSYVKDIDPQAERVILQCLEKDPKRRPASVIQVAASLSGNNPLAAALAAGETPSPEMVAAAGEKAGLRPAYAITCLIAIIIGLLSVTFLSREVNLIENVPFDNPPEALARKARDILIQLGYTDRPTDSAYGFAYDNEYLRYQRTQSQSVTRWSHPAAIYFWYRESPQYLEVHYNTSVPERWGGQIPTPPRVMEGDPLPLIPGMVNVRLDTMGRLLRFVGATPQIDVSTSLLSPPDWKMLFTAAGLDPARFIETKPKWKPSAISDARAAWTGTFSDRQQTPLRIEAAAWNGKPVYFEIITPWTEPDQAMPVQISRGSKTGLAIAFGMIFTIMIGTAFLVRHNLRLGRGDRRGAFRLTVFLFVILMLHWLVGASHVPTLHEFQFFIEALGVALFHTILIWLAYLALEPYVRGRWPGTLISWNRLLAGNFRDALVGRDILIGLFYGIVIVMIHQLRIWLGGDPVALEALLNPLISTRTAASQFIPLMSYPVEAAFLFLTLLFLLNVLLRRSWLAAGLFILLGASEAFFTGPWSAVVSFSLIYAIHFFVLTRYGVVSEMASLFTIFTLINFPITTNLSAWYAGTSLFASLAVLALAVFAFYTSLGGQKVFRGSLLED